MRILGLHWFDVCSPWRIDIPLGALRKAGHVVREGPITDSCDLLDAEIVVLHRPNTVAALQTIEHARERGIPVIVDVDDLFLADQLPPLAPFSRAWHADFHRREAVAQVEAGVANARVLEDAPPSHAMERFHECLRLADAVTVTTAPLARAYASFNSSVHVLPNCYDDTSALWDLEPRKRDTVHIGFAGTDHHLDNLALLNGVLEPVLGAHPAARVVEAGGPALLPMINARPHQLVHLGTLPFEQFPLLLHEMDIVLAPLADLSFMRCKSNIRCIMAGLVGAPVVASPVGPYATYVEHGVNGFLARTREQWTEYVDRLVVDADLRRRMGEANRLRARMFAMSANVWRWKEVYEQLLSRHRRA